MIHSINYKTHYQFIVYIRFPDKSTIVLSQRGRVVTFMDGEERRRRVTITTHQALSAEFFYNLNDPKDQIKTIQDELDQITRARKTQGGLHLMPGPCNLHKDSETCGDETCRANTLETRPQFNLEEDTDLYLFPRPNLEGQIQTALKGILPSTQDLLAAGQDASQIEERPIRSVDKQVVIRQMSFKSLHEEIVLRLRIAQRLMRERAIWLAQKRVKKEKEERARAKKQCQ
jgi:hypothetical protein